MINAPERVQLGRVTSGKIQAFRFPTESPESDGTAEWDSTTALIVELQAGGESGIGYSYADQSAFYIAEHLIQTEVLGTEVGDLPQVHMKLNRAVRNMGRPGVASCAIAAIDNCLWDLKAKLLGVSLLQLLGISRREIAAYGSGGFTSYTDKRLIEQLTGWADDGIGSVKMKIGREPEKDVARVSSAQDALCGRSELYVDANGAYGRKQALEKSRIFGDLGVVWFEEPVTSDDRIGLRYLVDNSPPGVRIAAGEYAYVLDDFRLLIEAGAIDVLQADATRCGGTSNFMKADAACQINHLPLSAHTAPTMHATLCCAADSAINVEYFYDHVRIEQLIFDGAIQAVNGMLRPDVSRPGFGIDLKVSDAEPYKILSKAVES